GAPGLEPMAIARIATLRNRELQRDQLAARILLLLQPVAVDELGRVLVGRGENCGEQIGAAISHPPSPVARRAWLRAPAAPSSPRRASRRANHGIPSRRARPWPTSLLRQRRHASRSCGRSLS